MSATQSQPLAVRFAGIIAVLRQALGTRVGRPGKPGLPGPLLVAIWNRLGRMVNRFNRLAARLEAGTLTPPRRRPTAPRRTAAARPPPDGIMLPRGRGWLVRLVQATAVGSGYLRVLLDDPEMQALMAAAPQAGL